MIERKAKNQLINKLQPGKVIVLLGARRVGKTYLLNTLTKELTGNIIFWNGEDFAIQDILKRRSVQHYKNILGDCDTLIIDEAQKIPEIGAILKLIVDSFTKLKIIVTGSSAFDISNSTGEPLTGRKYEIQLFPISEEEIFTYEQPSQRIDNLHQRLVYGNMPELLSISGKKEKYEYLREIVNSYLLKDILAHEKIKNSAKMFDLLRLVAFQIGNEVSLVELGTQLNISKNTVERYLDLLAKNFIVHKVSGFSRNLRKEIVKNSKWYFCDNGIRNTIISNMNDFSNRDDTGALWEQYIINERIKTQKYNSIFCNNYFWRTYDQQEIDWIEEREGNLFAHEIKLKKQKAKPPKAWEKSYPNSQFSVINEDNYLEWLVFRNL